ncbi:MAG: class D sortase, partial [Gemmatimonadaceae bacterium]
GVGDAELNSAPGHLTGSAIPGEPGNSVLSAHRDRHFHGLDRLLPGDTLTTESALGRITWIVETRRVVGQRSPALFATTSPVLTLTTCWPVRYFGPAPDRLIVTAKPLRVERTA